MESSDYHSTENNKSFIGFDPIASICINSGEATLRYPDGTTECRPVSGKEEVEHAINGFLSAFDIEGEYANYCGVYGYTTFNAVKYFEHITIWKTSPRRQWAIPFRIFSRCSSSLRVL